MWFIYALIIGAVVLGVQGGMLLLRSHKTEKSVNRRLLLSAQGATPTAVLETLRRERGFSNFESPFLTQLSDYWTQTGLRFDATKIIISYLGIVVALFLIFTLTMGLGVAPFLLAIVGSVGLSYLILSTIRKKRIARFADQLADAIEVIVRGVKVGYPFSSALTLVAKEMPDPIGTEFGMTADEIAFGLDVQLALQNLYRRVGQEDLLFLIIAISVQSQTGGRLADILTRLARLIRQRATLRLKVKALSAEGRLSAIFLTLMPFVLVGVISLISPKYFGSVIDHPALVPAVVLGLTLLLAGNLIMYRMVNFKF
jgi:tight adherence protein B